MKDAASSKIRPLLKSTSDDKHPQKVSFPFSVPCPCLSLLLASSVSAETFGILLLCSHIVLLSPFLKKRHIVCLPNYYCDKALDIPTRKEDHATIATSTTSNKTPHSIMACQKGVDVTAIAENHGYCCSLCFDCFDCD